MFWASADSDALSARVVFTSRHTKTQISVSAAEPPIESFAPKDIFESHAAMKAPITASAGQRKPTRSHHSRSFLSWALTSTTQHHSTMPRLHDLYDEAHVEQVLDDGAGILRDGRHQMARRGRSR